MAPPKTTRRSSNQPTSAASSQQQLSFRTGGGSTTKPTTSVSNSNSNNAKKSPTQDPKNKISKPLSAAARASLASAAGTKTLHARKSLLSTSDVVDIDLSEDVAAEDTTSAAAVEAKSDVLPEKTKKTKAEEEEDTQTRLASKVTQAQISRYWSAREAQRTAPRVHQKGLAVREKVLREFDMSSRYGPSIGIPRIQRWRRAHSLRMAPPIEVLAVLVMEEKEGRGVKASRSIVDELLDSKVEG